MWYEPDKTRHLNAMERIVAAIEKFAASVKSIADGFSLVIVALQEIAKNTNPVGPPPGTLSAEERAALQAATVGMKESSDALNVVVQNNTL